MILSRNSIRDRCIGRYSMIDPFTLKDAAFGLSYGLSLAGYDIRVAQELLIPPNGFILASSVERFEMPLDLLAIVHDKSTWARQGLTVQNTIIEPGWRGHLTLELTNHSSQIIHLYQGHPIAQVIFHLLDEPVDRGYEGKYQDQQNLPQPALF